VLKLAVKDEVDASLLHVMFAQHFGRPRDLLVHLGLFGLVLRGFRVQIDE